MRFLGIKVIRFAPKIKGVQLTLRLRRIRDNFILSSRFSPELIREIDAEALESSSPTASPWRRLRSIFQVLYVIERNGTYAHRIVGFIGIYDLDIGRRVSISAVLFDPKDRRQGYGPESVHLLLNFLRKVGIAKEVHVEVLKGNLPSLIFFQKMGFKIHTAHSDSLSLTKKLDKM